MVNPHGGIVAVVQEYANTKLSCGWVVVARESDLLPFNPPYLIEDPSESPTER